MIGSLPPGWLLILGSLLVPLLPGRLRALWLVALPALSFAQLWSFPTDLAIDVSLFDHTISLVRVDRLSLCFGYVFHIAAFLAAIFALHVRDATEQTAAMAYVGTAMGAIFAGDLVSLFVYWELTAITSVFLVWARRTPQAFRAGLRYLAIQVGSGVILLAGVLVHYVHSGSFAFGPMGLQEDDPGTWLIFVAFGIKCAFPLLHNWLLDAYPEATATGTEFLSAFTTKLAVYALARGFPGTEILVPIGAAMAVFPIFYAVIENDLRRVLAYSMNNQLGFMVVGIGVGTPMALNGAVSHAFADILFKGLLFMSMGAVLFRTGTMRATELGGLYRSMPLTAVFCIIGAASISAFPLFSAFATKSLVMTAAADGHYTIVWFMLLFASAGVFHHAGIKIPFFAFFAHDSGIRCKEAPPHMLLAMALAAVLCVGIGVQPHVLYDILPYKVAYEPYTTPHVVNQLQLLCLSALAFAILKRTGIYPPELRSTNLDFDWVYRRMLPMLYSAFVLPILRALDVLRVALVQGVPRGAAEAFGRPEEPSPDRVEPWGVGATVLMFTILLLVFLIINLWL